jgi:hypothetical protein
MSIENSIKRNRKENTTIFDDHRIVKFTKEQEKATQEWIVPHAQEIVADAEDIRKKVDAILLKRLDLKNQLRLHNEVYPEGMCNFIVSEFSYLMKGELLNRDYRGMQAVKNFVRAGGLIQPFWGVDKDMYFQNAIQLGTSILDVANDTVDRKKPPVVFYPDSTEAPLKNIESMAQFADIAEKYWRVDVYPNIYLPWFAPAFPMLFIRRSNYDGKAADNLMLETQTSHLMVRNLHTLREEHLFGLSSDFLFKSHYSEKHLPPDMLEMLLGGEKEWWKAQQRRRPDVFKITADPADAEAALRRFYLREDAKEIPEEYIRELREMNALGWKLDRYVLAQVGR